LSVFITLVVLKRFEKRRFGRFLEIQLQIDFEDMREVTKEIMYYFSDKNIKVINIDIKTKRRLDSSIFDSVVYTLLVPKNIHMHEVKEQLYNSTNIINVSVL